MAKAIETVESLIQNSTTDFQSKKHVCPYCLTEIPPKEIEVFGRKRLIQPVCVCEAEQVSNFYKDAASYQEKKDIERLFSIHNLGKRLQKSNFSNFEVRPGSEKCYELAKKYVSEFDVSKGESFMFWGIPGNGKSHLAAAITNELIALDKAVVFISMPDLLEKIKSTFNKKSVDSESMIMKALQQCDLLVIDDIGAEKVSDWVQEVIFRIVDGRYKRIKPILVTSNLEPKELSEQIGWRAYDRLIEISQPIQNEAKSYRREIAKKRMEKFLLS